MSVWRVRAAAFDQRFVDRVGAATPRELEIFAEHRKMMGLGEAACLAAAEIRGYGSSARGLDIVGPFPVCFSCGHDHRRVRRDGEFMYEEMTYDEDGNNQAGSLMDYLVPTAVETQAWETGHTINLSPHHPLGAKGVGESATVGAPPAIANALVDALAHLGVTHMEIPIRPDRVWGVLAGKGVAG